MWPAGENESQSAELLEGARLRIRPSPIRRRRQRRRLRETGFFRALSCLAEKAGRGDEEGREDWKPDI